jgi:FkbM family methyltransferase
MNKFLKNIFRPLLGKTFGQKLFSFLYLVSLKGMNFGRGTNPEDSGEKFVANFALKKLGHDILVFDVGGNKGEYTKMWLDLASKSNINLQVKIFEPSTHALKILNNNFYKNNKVEIINVAVGEQDGEAILYSDHPGSGLGSLAKRDLNHTEINMSEEEKVRVRSLDSFCNQKGIAKIDFLKLDVEGYELAALKGAMNLIRQSKIHFIQFEFGGTDIDTRVFFKDFFKLFSPQYKIFRILKNGLYEIKKYSELDEIFLTTNYLAEIKLDA